MVRKKVQDQKKKKSIDTKKNNSKKINSKKIVKKEKIENKKEKHSVFSKVINIIKLIRVKHWIKNGLVFIPLICSKQIMASNIINVILGFFSFSLIASTIYIINDLKDIEKDKLHPRKKNRPLASGAISKKEGIIIAILIFFISLVLNEYIFNFKLLNYGMIFILSYFIINVLYSLKLKNVAIIDITLLASGFILRVYYGASLINVEVSNWLFLTILNASFFLGLGKRRKEFLNAKDSRTVLAQYDENFLREFQYLTLALVFVFYSLWTIEQNINYLFLTIPLIMIIFMKYSLDVEKNDDGDPTTLLFQDKVLIGLCGIYGISMVLLLLVI